MAKPKLTPQQQARANLQQRQALMDSGELNAAGNFTETPSVRAVRKVLKPAARAAIKKVKALPGKAMDAIGRAGNAVGQAVGRPFNRYNKVIKVNNKPKK